MSFFQGIASEFVGKNVAELQLSFVNVGGEKMRARLKEGKGRNSKGEFNGKMRKDHL